MKVYVTTNEAHLSLGLHKIFKSRKISDIKTLEEDPGFEVIKVYDQNYDLTNLEKYRYHKSWYKVDRPLLLELMDIKVLGLEKKVGLINNWTPKLLTALKVLLGTNDILSIHDGALATSAPLPTVHSESTMHTGSTTCGGNTMPSWMAHDLLSQACKEQNPLLYQKCLSHYTGPFNYPFCLGLFATEPFKAQKKFMSSFVINQYEPDSAWFYNNGWTKNPITFLSHSFEPLWETKYAVFVDDVQGNEGEEFLFERKGKLIFNPVEKNKRLLPASTITEIVDKIFDEPSLNFNPIVLDSPKLKKSRVRTHESKSSKASTESKIQEPKVQESKSQELKIQESKVQGDLKVPMSESKVSELSVQREEGSKLILKSDSMDGGLYIKSGSESVNLKPIESRRDALLAISPFVNITKNATIERFIVNYIIPNYSTLAPTILVEDLLILYNVQVYAVPIDLKSFLNILRFSTLIQKERKVDKKIEITFLPKETIEKRGAK